MMIITMVVGNNQFTAQKEGGVSLGSNGMSNNSVGIIREGEIVFEKGLLTAVEDAVLTEYMKSYRLRWDNYFMRFCEGIFFTRRIKE
ncbi:hypothetical protein PVK06_041256 [Gossypium arboreum]|uniref:Uncharacterized protein n=1 Tax=Gossypium arboreum TaxID=29729 RepID=A0ABR0N7Q1_GOSAR|nr:hypothetical protein PVK06_041256 [Gossypium arboreum]